MICLATEKSKYFVYDNVYAFPVARQDAIARNEQWGDMLVLSHVFERESTNPRRPAINLLLTARVGELYVEFGNYEGTIRLFGRNKQNHLALRACQAIASAAKLFHLVENGTFDPEAFRPARRRSTLNPTYAVRVGLFVAEVYV